MDTEEEAAAGTSAGGLPFRVAAGIPRIDINGRDRGRLLEALRVCSVVFLEVESGDGSSGTRICQPRYDWWQDILSEALHCSKTFYRRPCLDHRHLRFSWREDLKRTREGLKDFDPDERVMFGISDGALHQHWLDWADYWWIPQEYRRMKEVLSRLMQRELGKECSSEDAPKSLGAKLREGKEKWSQSALRHCFYWSGGSCSEHTDYGLVSLHHSTAEGLEALVGGRWRSIEPPPGCMVLFAGDMMERLTNGRVRALLHRVRIPGDPAAAKGRKGPQTRSWQPRSRQSQILFLQPDSGTLVRPLAQFLAQDGTDLPAVRYGDWHREKVNLAFGRTSGGKLTQGAATTPHSEHEAASDDSPACASPSPAAAASSPSRRQRWVKCAQRPPEASTEVKVTVSAAEPDTSLFRFQ